MCFVRISEETVTFVLYVINRLVFITEVESVYSAVRFGSLYITQIRRVLKGFYSLMESGLCNRSGNSTEQNTSSEANSF
jgi:hypothetical protein